MSRVVSLSLPNRVGFRQRGTMAARCLRGLCACANRNRIQADATRERGSAVNSDQGGNENEG